MTVALLPSVCNEPTSTVNALLAVTGSCALCVCSWLSWFALRTAVGKTIFVLSEEEVAEVTPSRTRARGAYQCVSDATVTAQAQATAAAGVGEHDHDCSRVGRTPDGTPVRFASLGVSGFNGASGASYEVEIGTSTGGGGGGGGGGDGADSGGSGVRTRCSPVRSPLRPSQARTHTQSHTQNHTHHSLGVYVSVRDADVLNDDDDDGENDDDDDDDDDDDGGTDNRNDSSISKYRGRRWRGRGTGVWGQLWASGWGRGHRGHSVDSVAGGRVVAALHMNEKYISIMDDQYRLASSEHLSEHQDRRDRRVRNTCLYSWSQHACRSIGQLHARLQRVESQILSCLYGITQCAISLMLSVPRFPRFISRAQPPALGSCIHVCPDPQKKGALPTEYIHI